MAEGHHSSVARFAPTPEEVRRNQENAQRVRGIIEQSVSAWGGAAEDLHRAAREEAARQIAAEPLSDGMYGSAHGVDQMRRAPGKMFSRSDILAIIRGQIAITHDSHMRDLLTIFENLE